MQAARMGSVTVLFDHGTKSLWVNDEKVRLEDGNVLMIEDADTGPTRITTRKVGPTFPLKPEECENKSTSRITTQRNMLHALIYTDSTITAFLTGR